MRGRPPKPTQIHILEGTFRPDNHGERADLQVTPIENQPPAWASPRVREAWGKLAEPLAAMGLLDVPQSRSLSLLADAYADWMDLSAKLDEMGWMLEDDEGGQFINPIANQKDKAWKRVLAGLREFGLTPAAATQVKIKGVLERPHESKVRFFNGPKLAAGE